MQKGQQQPANGGSSNTKQRACQQRHIDQCCTLWRRQAALLLRNAAAQLMPALRVPSRPIQTIPRKFSITLRGEAFGAHLLLCREDVLGLAVGGVQHKDGSAPHGLQHCLLLHPCVAPAPEVTFYGSTAAAECCRTYVAMRHGMCLLQQRILSSSWAVHVL